MLHFLPQGERLLSGTLSAYLSAVATEMTVNNPPDSAKLPTLIELEPSSDAPETVRVTAVSGNVCTIERGVYNSGTGSEHQQNSAYKQKITEEHWDAVVTALENGYLTEDPSLLPVSRDSTTAFTLVGIDHTAFYTKGRVLRINDGDEFCTVVSSSLVSDDTVVVVNGDSLPASITNVELGLGPVEMIALQILYTDIISEKTSAAGVTVDGVLLKDSQVTTDVINEKTGGAGVTIDSLLIKDGYIQTADGTVIADANGNEILKILKTASAVNEFTMKNAATGGNPILSMTGGDTDIGLDIKMKGVGKMRKPTVVQVPCFGASTDCATGDGKSFFEIPEELNGMNLVACGAFVYTAGVTNTMDIQIRNITQAADMLSTKITIDTNEVSSRDAAAPPVIDAANDDVATGDRIAFDFDAVQTTAAKGAVVWMRFELP